MNASNRVSFNKNPLSDPSMSDLNSNSDPSPGRPRGTFSIKAILVFTTVFAAGAASLAHLVRASFSGQPNDIGIFVITTMIAPMAVMIGASWIFWLAGKLR